MCTLPAAAAMQQHRTAAVAATAAAAADSELFKERHTDPDKISQYQRVFGWECKVSIRSKFQSQRRYFRRDGDVYLASSWLQEVVWKDYKLEDLGVQDLGSGLFGPRVLNLQKY